jgi:hypothetical protein
MEPQIRVAGRLVRPGAGSQHAQSKGRTVAVMYA